MKFAEKLIELIFSMREKDEKFNNALQPLRSDFYDVGAFSFLFPVESKVLGDSSK